MEQRKILFDYYAQMFPSFEVLLEWARCGPGVCPAVDGIGDEFREDRKTGVGSVLTFIHRLGCLSSEKIPSAIRA